MKNHTKILIFLIVFLSFENKTLSQNTITDDPLKKFKHFYEMSIGVGANRANTENVSFTTPNGTYNFYKNDYLPSFEGTFNIGWLFNDLETKSIYSIKTGINIYSRSANLVDPNNETLRLQTGYLQIPVQVGIRLPMNHHTIKNNYFKAFEINTGVYAAIPISEKLDYTNNVDSRADSNTFANYVRFGTISEINFSSLNEKGNGDKFGLRFSTDFMGIWKLKETKYGLYPSYINISFFYNINNRYKL